MSWGELPFDKLLSTRKKLSNSRNGGDVPNPRLLNSTGFHLHHARFRGLFLLVLEPFVLSDPVIWEALVWLHRMPLLYAFTYSNQQCLSLRDQVGNTLRAAEPQGLGTKLWGKVPPSRDPSTYLIEVNRLTVNF